MTVAQVHFRCHSAHASRALESYESTAVVFATPELVEQILLQLPLLDQFVAMRVNRLCRDTVLKVRSLRERMQLSHPRVTEESSLRRYSPMTPTRFFLGTSSSLFDTSPLFLSGLGSLFYGTTLRGLYKGFTGPPSSSCALHFDIAPFYFVRIHYASDVHVRHIELVFRWHPSEAWLEGRYTPTTQISEIEGRLIPLASEGSWKKMMISPMNLPVKVTVVVTTPLGYNLFRPWPPVNQKNRFLTQTESFQLVLQPDHATLGEMTFFLKVIQAEALRTRQIWKNNDPRLCANNLPNAAR